MRLRERLAAWAGVWEGTYTHMTAAGRQLDSHGSRQETRLEGDDWYERVIYQWDDGRREQHDFRARMSGEVLLFDDPDFQATTHLVTESIVVFPYSWKSRPEERIVETIVFSGDHHKTRLWQRFVAGRLEKLTSITEERKPHEEPDVWF